MGTGGRNKIAMQVAINNLIEKLNRALAVNDFELGNGTYDKFVSLGGDKIGYGDFVLTVSIRQVKKGD